MVINFDEINNIKADVIVGFGEDCRVAQALRRNKLRFFSNPFDWMMKYSLDNVINILSNNGKIFFNNIEENPERMTKKSRCITDTDTGMVSLHEFSSKLSLDKANIIFHKMMSKRFNRLDRILKKAESICIITSRKINIEDIKVFISKFTKLYQFEKIYYINTYNCEEEKFIKTNIDNKTEILELYFRDEHEDGSDPKQNPNFWLRNVLYWDKIMSKLSLNNSFVRRNKDSKFFGISYNLKEDCVQKIIYILGIKIKLKVEENGK